MALKPNFVKHLATQEAIDQLHYTVRPECDPYDPSEEDLGDQCVCELWKSREGLERPIWMMTTNHLENSMDFTMRRIVQITHRLDVTGKRKVRGLRRQKLMLQHERVHGSLYVLKVESIARGNAFSPWCILGDVFDWSPKGIDKLVQEVDAKMPF